MGSRPSPGNQGRSVGVAMGVIRINVKPLLDDARQVNAAYKSMGDAGKQIGTGVKVGTDQAKKELGSLNQVAAGVARQLAAAFALPVMVGFTQELKRSEFQLKLFSKNADDFNKRIKQAHDLAEDLKQPYDQVLATFATLSSMAKRYNLDLAETTKLVQRLTLISPEQGAEGSRIALQEFISGDITSLARRFELNRGDLRKILDQSNGDIRTQMQLFDEYIASLGFTNDALREMGEEGFNAFARLKSEVKETTADAFEPFLNNALIPMAEGTGDLLAGLRELNPELLDIAGTLSGILATVLALNAAGMGGPGLKLAGTALAAGFVGVEGGTALARAGAESGLIQNRRLENVSQGQAKEVLAETFGQAIVVAANGLIELYGIFRTGTETFRNAFERSKVTLEMIKLSFEMGAEVIKTAFNNLIIILENAGNNVATALQLMALDFRDAIADVIASLGQLLKDLPLGGGVDRKGQSLIDAATGGQATRDATRALLEDRAGMALDEGVTPITEALAPFTDEMQRLLGLLEDTPLGLTAEQAATIAEEVDNLKAKLPDLARMLGLLGEETGSWLDRMKEGFSNRGGTTPVSEPEEFTEKMLEAFSKFQQEIADLQKKADDDRKKAIAEAQKQRTEAAAKLEKEQSEVIQDTEKKRAELIKEANTESIQAEQDHQDRLADIRRNASRDIERAAARFDQAGVFNAQQREKDAIDDEKRNHEKQRTRRQEAIAEELIDLETAKQERLNELRTGYQEELAAIIQQRNEKLAQINASLRDELNQRNQAFAELHNRLVAEAREEGNHNVRMLNIQQAGTAQLEAQYRDWITRMGGYRPQATQQQVQQAQQNIQTAVKPIKIPGFAGGTGNTGRGGLAMLHPFEIVGDATTAALMRSVTGSQNPTQAQMRQAIAGGASNTYHFNGTLSFGDVGGYSVGQLKGLFMDSMREYMEAMAS